MPLPAFDQSVAADGPDAEAGVAVSDPVPASKTSSDVREVRSLLNYMYNGENGEGRFNSDGERVVFDFNVSEHNIDGNDKTSLQDLRRLAVKDGTQIESDMTDDNGKVYVTAADMFLITGSSAGGKGERKQNVSTVISSDKVDYETVAHETGHQLMTRSTNEEHDLMSEYGFRMDAKLVDAILNDALDAKMER